MQILTSTKMTAILCVGFFGTIFYAYGNIFEQCHVHADTKSGNVTGNVGRMFYLIFRFRFP